MGITELGTSEFDELLDLKSSLYLEKERIEAQIESLDAELNDIEERIREVELDIHNSIESYLDENEKNIDWDDDYWQDDED